MSGQEAFKSEADFSTAEANVASELASRFLLLKFRHESLEGEFRASQEWKSRFQRILLCAVAIFLVLTPRLYDDSLLHFPEAFRTLSHHIQLIMVVPLVIVIALARWIRNESWANLLLLNFAMVVVASGLELQRIAGRDYGVVVPQSFAVLAVYATLLLSGLRFRRAALITLCAMILVAAMELIGPFGSIRKATIIYYQFASWMQYSLAIIIAYQVEWLARKQWLLQKKHEFASMTDPLTRLGNRRFFWNEAGNRVDLAGKKDLQIAICVVDIDFFKQYNDTYGHASGDAVLKQVATIMSEAQSEPTDLVARVGGEEFALMLAGTNTDALISKIKLLTHKVKASNIPHNKSPISAFVTISAGVVCAPASAGIPIQELVEYADDLLYKAKKQGRDAVISRVIDWYDLGRRSANS